MILDDYNKFLDELGELSKTKELRGVEEELKTLAKCANVISAMTQGSKVRVVNYLYNVFHNNKF